MNKYFWPLIISIALCLGIFLGGFLVSVSIQNTDTNLTRQHKVKLSQLMDFIDKEYVDPIDMDSLTDNAIESMLKHLDPHSIYMNQTEFIQQKHIMQGGFYGLGINYYIYKDSVTVIKSLVNGPANISGILSGDRIVRVDQRYLFGKDLQQDSISNILKGQKNSTALLTIKRPGVDSLLNIKVVRSVIDLPSVDFSEKLANGFGYIKINKFSKTTYKEFSNALNELLSLDIKGLIIDLQDNSGGYLDQSVKILNDLLPNNQVILKTISKRGVPSITLAKSSDLFSDLPLYILVNSQSASASEIVAGAIQDNDRGVIVGEQTYGKGLVQKEFLLGDGSAIRLTTARYYTPSGRSIQRAYPYNEAVHGAPTPAKSEPISYKTLKGRNVFANGGITPDVQIDSSNNRSQTGIAKLGNSRLVDFYVFQYIDNYRKDFKDKNFQQVLAYLEQQKDIIFSGFQQHVNNNRLSLELESKKDEVLVFLNTAFVDQLFDRDTYYRYLNSHDPILRRTMQEIENM